jgi:hypothetical protein
MSIRLRLLAGALTVGMLAAACTSDGGSGPDGDSSPTGPIGGSPTAVVPTSPEVVPPAEDGPGSALAALEKLCTIPQPDVGGPSGGTAEGPTPPAIAQVMDEVEQIRGLRFTEPVLAEPVGQQDIAEGYAHYIDAAFPEDYYARRSLAWQTIGVIPEGSSIRDAMLEYGSTQVIGYYDTLTGELKFIGEEDPSPLDRITLAHELTHAIDDQHFALERIDQLGADCRDEDLEASVGLVEGNATFFMYQWAQTFLTLDEQVEVGVEAASQQPPPADIPPFIDATQLWPYTAGLGFIQTLDQEGGLEAIDAAFENPPVSTEQVMHPERYPNDVPVPVDVPDLSGDLGDGWTDLDVQVTGEMWLDQALRLRLGGTESDAAAAGWDGGTYRAWSDGDRIAIVLATAWDSEADAAEFAEAMGDWVAESGQPATVLPAEGTTVRVLFASDAATLSALEAAAT